MFEFLLYSGIACADADAVILRIQKHENLKPEWKLELGRDCKRIYTRMLGRKRLKNGA